MRLTLRFFNVAFHITWHVVRYGLLRLAHLFTLDKARRQEKNELRLGATIRALLQGLGATYIKLGQILSSRPDLLPPYITNELAVLQDRVPPFPCEGGANKSFRGIPANILFDDEGNCYILDLGLVNNGREDYLLTFLRFNLAISQRDGKGVARAYAEEYGIQPKDYDAFETDCCAILDELEGKNASDIEFAKYVLDMFKMIRRHHLHMDPNVTLLNVAYLTFEGMSRMFDPQMDVMSIYANEMMRVPAKPE